MNHDQLQLLRQYLLGEPLAAAECSKFEERLLTDDEFCEQVDLAEDELIDQYLSAGLSVEERALFEQRFLVTDERQVKFKIARSLNRYATTKVEQFSAKEAVAKSNKSQSTIADKPSKFSLVPSWFGPRVAIYAALAAVFVMVIGGVLLWRQYLGRSDIDQGLSALAEAFRQQRPGQSRITGLGYAPASATRGGGSNAVNSRERDRAERLLQDAAHQQHSPAALHALGRLYLAERQFDKAIEQFDMALNATPNDARLQSDLGAALIERGNNEAPSASEGARLADFALSLEHLNRALTLDSSLLDALFNRALLYEDMKLPRQAADDWRRYLELDPSSPWAAEARGHLKLLDEQHEVSDGAPETLRKFLDAYRARDDERAWKVWSSSREMITGRMVVFQLARKLLDAETIGQREAANECIGAMVYAGNLESHRTGDPFVIELANYYSVAMHSVPADLASAQAALLDGYRLCQSSHYDDARKHFESARSLFLAARDTNEARLTDYWIAYCTAQGDQLEKSVALLDDLAAFSKRQNYRWLLSQALCLLANSHDLLGDHSRSLTLDREAHEIAVSLQDTYTQQKVLTQLALQYAELGRPEHALDYHARTISLADSGTPTPRQDWRNFTYAAQTFYLLKRYDAAAAYEREALQLGLRELADPALQHRSYTDLGMILAGAKRYDEALQQARAGLEVARTLQDDSASRKMIAYSLLQMAHLSRQSGDCGSAVEDYDRALALYDGMEISKLDGYDAHKGRLLCYVNGRDDSISAKEMDLVLQLFEQNRDEITEEQNRNSYFDAEQDIYDIAISYFYSRGYQRQAFAYSERSRARSLLDLLTHGVRTAGGIADPEIAITANASPLDLDALQTQLSANSQIVEYTALKDRLLIWFISPTRFEVREQNVGTAHLNELVLDYVTLLGRNDQSQTGDIKERAQALYDLLIGPVLPLVDNSKELCVVPDKALFHLPFAALVAPATGHYLIQDFTLLFSPSASVLVHCSQTAQNRGTGRIETLASVGNPAFDRKAYPELANLPAAEVEAKEVGQLYGGPGALTGVHAQKSAFLDLLSNASVIHFAGHYVADERSPMRSRLLLAANPRGDDVLTAAEIFSRRLPRVRLVVLSACQTEFEGYDSGEGMIGIARTFLAAGAPLVVASQWSVDSDATAELMITFHRFRKQALTTSVALRRAQEEMLTGADERYRNPYYWAAFLPVGGHADY